jgi:hypothetical protein
MVTSPSPSQCAPATPPENNFIRTYSPGLMLAVLQLLSMPFTRITVDIDRVLARTRSPRPSRGARTTPLGKGNSSLSAPNEGDWACFVA